MHFWDSVNGIVKCKLISASLDSTLHKISQKCEIWNLKVIDDLTATFSLKRCNLGAAMQIDDSITVINRTGLVWLFKYCLKRPVLLAGICILLLLILYLPTRVLFINIYGNEKISKSLILDVSRQCGVSFGSPRRKVRSEMVKTVLLQNIPQLQWACVNTNGCVAEIFVQERRMDNLNNPAVLTEIVADRDGIITGLTVYSGTPLCEVGEIVKKGQLLVSGYADRGLLIKSESANAEIMAETTRNVEVVALSQNILKKTCRKVNSRFGLIIGKKLINFYKGSGISPPGCGRINKIYHLTLPGGFRLPVAVVKEETYYYDVAHNIEGQADVFNWLNNAADTYICGDMVAGQIIHKAAHMENDGEIFRLYAQYRCNEMIGTLQQKEMFQIHGTRN